MGKKLGALLLVLFFVVCIVLLLSMVPELLLLMNQQQLAFWTVVLIFIPLNIVFLFLYAFGIRNKSTGSVLISLGAAFLLIGGLILFTMSVKHIGLNSSLALVLIAPIFFLIMAPLFSKETINGAQMLSLILTAAGGAFILYSRGLIHPASWESISFILGAAACWAGFSLLALKTKTGVFINVYVYTLIGLIISTILLFTQSSFVLPSYSSLGTMLIFSALAVAAMFLWAGTFRHSSASFWASMVFVLPAGMLLYDLIFKSASLGIFGIVGLSLTGFAVIYRMFIKM